MAAVVVVALILIQDTCPNRPSTCTCGSFVVMEDFEQRAIETGTKTAKIRFSNRNLHNG